MLGINHASLLKNALTGTGFVRRGSAFFRIWGDGVLQVLKFQRHHGDRVRDLSVGVFSMYGSLYPEWFTSNGCIPRGSVVNFIGLQFVDGYLSRNCFTKTDNDQYFYHGFSVMVDSNRWLRDEMGVHWKYHFTPEQQITILTAKVLPWLNDMTNQSLAAKAMYQIWSVPNDSLRFDAHLAAGELKEAEETMSAILAQHAGAKASWERTFSPEKFAQMSARLEAEDAPLISALKMVQDKDAQAISEYLSNNYNENCKLAKFCMK